MFRKHLSGYYSLAAIAAMLAFAPSAIPQRDQPVASPKVGHGKRSGKRKIALRSERGNARRERRIKANEAERERQRKESDRMSKQAGMRPGSFDCRFGSLK